jgi:hypothetical protein
VHKALASSSSSCWRGRGARGQGAGKKKNRGPPRASPRVAGGLRALQMQQHSGWLLWSPSVESPSGGASVAYFFYFYSSSLRRTSKTFQYSRSMRGGLLYSPAASVYIRTDLSSSSRSNLTGGQRFYQAVLLLVVAISRRPSRSLFRLLTRAALFLPFTGGAGPCCADF